LTRPSVLLVPGRPYSIPTHCSACALCRVRNSFSDGTRADYYLTDHTDSVPGAIADMVFSVSNDMSYSPCAPWLSFSRMCACSEYLLTSCSSCTFELSQHAENFRASTAALPNCVIDAAMCFSDNGGLLQFVVLFTFYLCKVLSLYLVTLSMHTLSILEVVYTRTCDRWLFPYLCMLQHGSVLCSDHSLGGCGE
jgi:hypothetical protein